MQRLPPAESIDLQHEFLSVRSSGRAAVDLECGSRQEFADGWRGGGRSCGIGPCRNTHGWRSPRRALCVYHVSGLDSRSLLPDLGRFGRRVLRRTLDLARLADRLGFRRFWLAQSTTTCLPVTQPRRRPTTLKEEEKRRSKQSKRRKRKKSAEEEEKKKKEAQRRKKRRK